MPTATEVLFSVRCAPRPNDILKYIIAPEDKSPLTPLSRSLGRVRAVDASRLCCTWSETQFFCRLPSLVPTWCRPTDVVEIVISCVAGSDSTSNVFVLPLRPTLVSTSLRRQQLRHPPATVRADHCGRFTSSTVYRPTCIDLFSRDQTSLLLNTLKAI